MVQLFECEVGGFYVEYKECLFFKDLVFFMIFGLVVVQVLEGEDVIVKNCELMGVIDLKKVDVGIICVDFVVFIDENVVYGFDFEVFVVCEIVYFFVVIEVCECIC